jgi:hypothetical protein
MIFTREHAKQNRDMLKVAKRMLKAISLNPDAYTTEDLATVKRAISSLEPSMNERRVNNAVTKAIRQIRYEYFYK